LMCIKVPVAVRSVTHRTAFIRLTAQIRCPTFQTVQPEAVAPALRSLFIPSDCPGAGIALELTASVGDV